MEIEDYCANNFPRSNPKRLKEKPLIYSMEKISIIGSYKNRYSEEETSLAMAIQMRCLDKLLKGLNMKEIYDVMFDIVKKYGDICFYHRFCLYHEEKNRIHFDIHGYDYRETKYYRTGINNLKQKIEKSLDLDKLFNYVLFRYKGLGWKGVHYINIIISKGKVVKPLENRKKLVKTG